MSRELKRFTIRAEWDNGSLDYEESDNFDEVLSTYDRWLAKLGISRVSLFDYDSKHPHVYSCKPRKI